MRVQQLLYLWLIAGMNASVGAVMLTMINETKRDLRIELIAHDVYNPTKTWILVERVPFTDGAHPHSIKLNDNRDDKTIPYLIACFKVIAIASADDSNYDQLTLGEKIRFKEQPIIYRVYKIEANNKDIGLEIRIVPQSFFHHIFSILYRRLLIPAPCTPGHRCK